MRPSSNLLRVAAAGLLAALPLLTALPAAAQTTHDHSKPAAAAPAATASAALAATTITALQQALNATGHTVKVDGVLGDDTRAALRTYQSHHGLPVTGEPDAATLEKLGVKPGATSAAAAPAKKMGMGMMKNRMAAQAAAAPSGTTPGANAQGGMAGCGMMQGDMKQMAQMMQNMSQKMQAMEQRMQGMQNQPPKQN